MTHELLLKLMATAEQLDGPEAWVHLCVTAAEEARSAILADPPISPDNRGDTMRRLDELMQKRGRETESREFRLSGDRLAEAAHAAAASAFRTTLPHITNRRSIQCFVCCVAAGVLRNYISVRDANSLLYAAQAALTAFPKRKSRTAK